MITEFFVWIMAATARLVFSVFPAGPESGSTASSVQTALGTVFGFAADLSNWLPWGSIAPAVAVVGGILLAVGIVKLVRIVASFLTFGGGSAA